ncbi:hypothetical protein EDC32_103262 [Laceyella sacchari]|nr:hypothetical protein EDC32_103262 [Laceyella sacchari]
MGICVDFFILIVIATLHLKTMRGNKKNGIHLA